MSEATDPRAGYSSMTKDYEQRQGKFIPPRRIGDTPFQTWFSKMVCLTMVLFFLALGGLFYFMTYFQGELEKTQDSIITSRENNHKGRAVLCIDFRDDQGWLPEPCKDPNVMKYMEPTPPTTMNTVPSR